MERPLRQWIIDLDIWTRRRSGALLYLLAVPLIPTVLTIIGAMWYGA